MANLNQTPLIKHDAHEWILRNFFSSHFHDGWSEIAEKLIKNGTCVVAGNDCIWKGTIGNFIEVEDVDEFIGCVRYNFNLNDFLKSEWFRNEKESYLEKLNNEISRLNELRDSISKPFISPDERDKTLLLKPQ